MTTSQELAMERIRRQLDRRLKGSKDAALTLFEVAEENTQYIYVHWVIRPTFTDEYGILTAEALIRIGKRGGASYDTGHGYRPYRYDVRSMTAAELAWRDL